MNVLLFILKVAVYVCFLTMILCVILFMSNSGKERPKYKTINIYGRQIHFNLIKGWAIPFILTFVTFVFMMVLKFK